MKKGVVLGCVMGVLTAVGSPARAGVSEAYVFSLFGTSPSGPTAVPFILTGTDGIQLFLDSSGVATSSAAIVANVLADIDTGVSYVSHTGTLNGGEGVGDMTARVNSELSLLDDVGLVSEGSDAARNVDFGGDAALILRLNAPITTLMIAEDAGLDPFRLEYSVTADFASPILLFDGFSSAVKSAVLGRSDFGGNDNGSDTDQIYFFRFGEALDAGYLRITETDNYGDRRLEVDTVGGTEAPDLIVIPEPSGFVLAGVGLCLATLVIRRATR